MKSIQAFYIVFNLVQLITSYNILGLFATYAKSNAIIGHKLMERLADAGNNVTFLSPYYPTKEHSSIRYIYMDKELEAAAQNTLLISYANHAKSNAWFRSFHYTKYCPIVTNGTLHGPAIKKLLNDSTQHFDVIITVVLNNEALLGVANYFRAPMIAFSILPLIESAEELSANLNVNSYMPHTLLHYSSKMSFIERIINALFHLYELVLFHWYHIPAQTKVYDEYFPNPKPLLSDLRKNLSLMLVNSHPVINFPRPYNPNTIEVGGINVERHENPLPPDLQELIDSSIDGVIYFSMGTNIRFNELNHKNGIDDFLKLFANLRQTIIWKLDIDELPELPKNVYVAKWFSQSSILAHPNMKIFISHGGLLSITEAIYFGVPIIGIPFILDQESNIESIVTKGLGLRISLSDFNANALFAAIQEMLSNEKYSNKAKELSTIYRDRPIGPLETAVYWIEYVARHKGALHLRPMELDSDWWQYHNLDVFACLFGIFIVFFFYGFWKVYNLIYPNSIV